MEFSGELRVSESFRLEKNIPETDWMKGSLVKNSGQSVVRKKSYFLNTEPRFVDGSFLGLAVY